MNEKIFHELKLKLIHLYKFEENIKMIVFMLSMDQYNEPSRQNGAVDGVTHGLAEFLEVCEESSLKKFPILIVMNRYDQFQKKVLTNPPWEYRGNGGTSEGGYGPDDDSTPNAGREGNRTLGSCVQWGLPPSGVGEAMPGRIMVLWEKKRFQPVLHVVKGVYYILEQSTDASDAAVLRLMDINEFMKLRLNGRAVEWRI